MAKYILTISGNGPTTPGAAQSAQALARSHIESLRGSDHTVDAASITYEDGDGKSVEENILTPTAAAAQALTPDTDPPGPKPRETV